MTVEVFSGPNCNYCKRAKDLLDRKGIAYADFDISEPEHRQEFARRLPRAQAIPQIFIDGEHIGGCEDLELLEKDGRLDARMSTTEVNPDRKETIAAER